MKKQFYERLTKYFAKRNHLGKLTGANCLWGNYLEGNYPVVIIRHPRDNYSEANCPGTIFLRAIVRGGGGGGGGGVGLFEGHLSEVSIILGAIAWGQFSCGAIAWKAIVWGEGQLSGEHLSGW